MFLKDIIMSNAQLERTSLIEVLTVDKIRLKEKLKKALDELEIKNSRIKELEKINFKELENNDEFTDDTITKLEDHITLLQKKIVNIETKYNEKLNEKNNEIELHYEKINGELIDTNRQLNEKINVLTNSIKKIQDNSKKMNSQFITALNAQKEIAEKEIRARDAYIKQLEQHINKITLEYSDKIKLLSEQIISQQNNTQNH